MFFLWFIFQTLKYSSYEDDSILLDRNLLESKDDTNTSIRGLIFNVIMIFLCVISASLACGLTQGLLSLNPLELQIKKRSGLQKEKICASKVLPLIENHHILLVSLMLFNATANEALPLFLDTLVEPYIAILLSVTIVLIFGEIIPSALFTGPDQLEIVSRFSSFTWFIITLLYPIAKPIAMILDKWLGHDDGMTIYNRSEIYTMMTIQQEEGPKRGMTSDEIVMYDEVTMIGGALRLRDVKVQQVMTKDVFMLSIEDNLDINTLSKIFNSGCSRIPIYEQSRNNVIGLILVKDLLFIDPEDDLSIRNFMALFGRIIPRVRPNDQLVHALKLFKQSHIHMAIVQDFSDMDDAQTGYTNDIQGIITMEDIFEELLGDEIYDEHDIDSYGNSNSEEYTYNKFSPFAKHSNLNPTVDFIFLKHFSSVMKSHPLQSNEIESITKLLEIKFPDIKNLLSKGCSLNSFIQNSQVLSTDLSNEYKQSCFIYKIDKISNACTFIIEGSVKIIRGDGTMLELGPHEILGKEALISEHGTFIPDFSSLVVSEKFRCLRMIKIMIENVPLSIPSRQVSISIKTPVLPSLSFSANERRARLLPLRSLRSMMLLKKGYCGLDKEDLSSRSIQSINSSSNSLEEDSNSKNSNEHELLTLTSENRLLSSKEDLSDTA